MTLKDKLIDVVSKLKKVPDIKTVGSSNAKKFNQAASQESKTFEYKRQNSEK